MLGLMLTTTEEIHLTTSETKTKRSRWYVNKNLFYNLHAAAFDRNLSMLVFNIIHTARMFKLICSKSFIVICENSYSILLKLLLIVLHLRLKNIIISISS